MIFFIQNMAWCLFGLFYCTRACTTFIIGIHSFRSEPGFLIGGGLVRAKRASFWGLGGASPSENFKITFYNDRLNSMRDPLQ